MAFRAIIRIGDPTSHGGTVLEGFNNFNVYGKDAAGIGHKVSCPTCKGNHFIIAGAKNFYYFGTEVAVEGMLTSCGAVLIATQKNMIIDITNEINNLENTLPPLKINQKEHKIEKNKTISRIFWTYGKDETLISDASRHYTDINIHVETLNYTPGETIEIKISNMANEKTSESTNNIKLYATINSDGTAKIINALKNHTMQIIAKK